MDWNATFDTVVKFFNSSFGFAVVWAAMVGFFIFLASKLNPFREAWKKYEGSIITGIKLAEKQIPDLPAGRQATCPMPGWPGSTLRCGSC